MPGSGSQRTPPVVRSMRSGPVSVDRSSARRSKSRARMSRIRPSIGPKDDAQLRRRPTMSWCVRSDRRAGPGVRSGATWGVSVSSSLIAAASPLKACSRTGPIAAFDALASEKTLRSTGTGPAASRAETRASAVSIDAVLDDEGGEVDRDLRIGHPLVDLAIRRRESLSRRFDPAPIFCREVVGRAGLAREGEEEVIDRADIPLDDVADGSTGEVAHGRPVRRFRGGCRGRSAGCGPGCHWLGELRVLDLLTWTRRATSLGSGWC